MKYGGIPKLVPALPYPTILATFPKVMVVRKGDKAIT